MKHLLLPSRRTFRRAVNAGDCADAIANSTAKTAAE